MVGCHTRADRVRTQELCPMSPSRRRLLHLCASGALAAPWLRHADAQTQQGTLRLVLGFPAGASSDAVTRVVGEQMGKTLGQSVIVDNKAGASGRLANEFVKAATADGTTLLVTPVATMSIFPHSYAGQLRYDPFKDFAPV